VWGERGKNRDYRFAKRKKLIRGKNKASLGGSYIKGRGGWDNEEGRALISKGEDGPDV